MSLLFWVYDFLPLSVLSLDDEISCTRLPQSIVKHSLVKEVTSTLTPDRIAILIPLV